ncbi:LysR family transcriptional regulator [Paraburkholderia aromaticivorans]|uniref:LysR family transcriptional regulator n=1 Tax=Paraburkholderia aromaticivorans TaxID=2026199 RepID=A0A248VWB9_9BURK|nr:LysR family transcriptional regulator [Paraburkholderia aromaticivorans]ASW03193.1 LysR family transcriptional regulator [Paraburkholderia aromaticivorans]
MDRLDCMRVFHMVSDLNSFAEAARQLRITPVAASRAVSALEQEIGVTLLRRTTRSVRLTDQGSDYLERTRHALSELEDAAEAVRGGNSGPHGLLVVTAPVLFGRMHVMPIVANLLREYQDLSVRLILVDRVVRLAEEGVDIGVRIGQLPDSSLRAVPLASVQRVLVASPDYLARRGAPACEADLSTHHLIAFETASLNEEWRRAGSRSQIEPRFLTNSVDATIEAAMGGLGIARLFSYHVARELADGRLVKVLTNADEKVLPVSLVYQGGRQQSQSVRAFISAAQAALPDRPAL